MQYLARLLLFPFLFLSLSLAAVGCGSSGGGAAGAGGQGGEGGQGGQGGQGGMGGATGVCADAPSSEPCGENGEVCDGQGQCVTCAEGEGCFSDGSDGGFYADEDVELPGGVYNFSAFGIAPGVTVRVTGSEPLIITTQFDVTLQGTLTADAGPGGNGVAGESSGLGGAGVAGGHDGGDGAYGIDVEPLNGANGLGTGAGRGGTDLGPGAGASYGSQGGNAALGDAVAGLTYGNAELDPLEPGSGAGGGSGGEACGGGGGGGGGGIIKLSVLGDLRLGTNAVISANGGNGGTDDDASCGGGGGGSGGTIWLRANNVLNDGLVSAQGGIGFGGLSNIGPVGGYGRVRIDQGDLTGTGVELPRSGLDGGPWYVPADMQ